MRKILTLPMYLLLTVKLWVALKLLTMAEEQTQDALGLVCRNCAPSDTNCERPNHCRVQSLKDREQAITIMIDKTRTRISLLSKK